MNLPKTLSFKWNYLKLQDWNDTLLEILKFKWKKFLRLNETYSKL